MFGMLESLTKAAVGIVVETPIAVATDVVTLGGALDDKETTHTGDALSNVFDNIKDATR